MFVTIVMVAAAIALYIVNQRSPYDPAEAEERKKRADARRERARRQPQQRSGPGRPSMHSS